MKKLLFTCIHDLSLAYITDTLLQPENRFPMYRLLKYELADGTWYGKADLSYKSHHTLILYFS